MSRSSLSPLRISLRILLYLLLPSLWFSAYAASASAGLYLPASDSLPVSRHSSKQSGETSLPVSGSKKNSGSARVLLPNGWSLSPAGTSTALGDLPLQIVLSPSKKLLAVTNNGQSTQSIQLIDASDSKLLDQVEIPKSFYGLAFSRDEKMLYASGGNDNLIRIYSVRSGKLRLQDSLVLGKPWPAGKISPVGIALDDLHNRLYTVTKEDSSLYVFNLQTRALVMKLPLGAEAYSCILRPGTNELAVSLWGADKVIFFNTTTLTVSGSIKVGDHPGEMVFNHKGNLLFAASGNENTVSVIDVVKKKELERLNSAVFPTHLAGSTPNGLALSHNEKTLYIANADNNCLAVFNVTNPGNSTSMGFIPTGWYPTNIKVSGNKIFVSNGKGFHSMANPEGPNPLRIRSEEGKHKGARASSEQYIGGLFKGTLSTIIVPSAPALVAYSKQVVQNTPFRLAQQDSAHIVASLAGSNPIPLTVSAKSSPIKHIFYIIKENRTYDQVLGDVKEGNGDSSLCIFPKKITPNQHNLTSNFVLCDNFYVDAEVSADGHNWSMAAYATDFVEKTWPTSYGGRGGNYDYEGTRKAAYPAEGFIWDHANREHITYRTYGEFAEYSTVMLKSLVGHNCNAYPGFELSIPDSVKERIWEHDFDSLAAIGQVPQLSTIRLANDHTSGMRKGEYSVISALADNDLAVGQLIEHLSKSTLWKESTVFILEDDAQNGSDHVDAHRSPVYLAGPYVKRHFADHSMYSTSGVLRTIELILGMKPMSQYDAAATPLMNAFTSVPDFSPYQLIPAQVNIHVRNMAWNRSAQRSALFNLTKEDAVPDLELNDVIWKAVKGEASTMPVPRRSAFVVIPAKKGGDND